MAGLWERWRGEDAAELESCTMIVTDANELVRGIHDRMPAILPAADRAAWLDPENRDTHWLERLLKPADPDCWTLYVVSEVVNSPRNDGPELIESVESRHASTARTRRLDLTPQLLGCLVFRKLGNTLIGDRDAKEEGTTIGAPGRRSDRAEARADRS
jgi:hypothetical protein